MSSNGESTQHTARRLHIRGVVQGVGFRPFVYRLAQQYGITGWVLNSAAGAEIHAEACTAELDRFMQSFQCELPPVAHIEQLHIVAVPLEGHTEFSIRHSQRVGTPAAGISPDLALCDDCRRELFDPSDRRRNYAYINCTNCGPRYSILLGLPYDRERTTLAAWPLCPQCRDEYEQPLDRRYHAQATCCPDCGPDYALSVGEQVQASGRAAFDHAAGLLRDGKIIAIKGIGGYHLACDAGNAAAVLQLRTRKYRKEKPFAVLVRDLDEARRWVELSPVHEKLLLDRARPIVLARARTPQPLLAPDNDSLGIMLPYAPTHELLFAAGAPPAIVLTSGNRSSEPIAYEDHDACERLAGIADAMLIGKRPIARRVDDSVVAVRQNQPMMVRRARGYAPASVCRVPGGEPILAVGADLKNSVALVVGGEVFVSQHLGDLEDLQTELAHRTVVNDLLSMYGIAADQLTVVHDLHPQFRSTRLAQSLPARAHLSVQHHHAHLASVLAEHGVWDAPAVGVIFDGTGFGTDGSIWGGEFLVGTIARGFERRASLRPVSMPGGDAAARWPLQAAAGFLAQCDELPDFEKHPFNFPPRYRQARALVDKQLRCHTSTSMGRLFDAVAALLGFTRAISFEGQAAMWLEHQSRPSWPQAGYAWTTLDWRPLIGAVVRDRLAGRAVSEIAAAFHQSIAQGAAEVAEQLCRQAGTSLIACSGGVFQNELLIDGLAQHFAGTGRRLLFNRAVPANDGGISLGQAAIVAMQVQRAF